MGNRTPSVNLGELEMLVNEAIVETVEQAEITEEE